jgi:very-short-patch-repair endonuclease
MDKRSMFYGASPTLFEKARQLRLNMTESERLLWFHLQDSKMGARFKAQHPIKSFIADFYCHKAKLIIEVDGDIHNLDENKEYDEGRTFELEQLGLKVIRFTNKEIKTEIIAVLKKIKAELGNNVVDPQPPKGG